MSTANRARRRWPVGTRAAKLARHLPAAPPAGLIIAGGPPKRTGRVCMRRLSTSEGGGAHECVQGMAYHGLHEAMRKKMEPLVGPRLDEVGVRHMA